MNIRIVRKDNDDLGIKTIEHRVRIKDIHRNAVVFAFIYFRLYTFLMQQIPKNHYIVLNGCRAKDGNSQRIEMLFFVP